MTITDNTADDGGGGGFVGDGGGMYVESGTVNIQNTIIAGNADSSDTGNVHPDVSGAFASNGYNLIGKSDGSTGFTNGVNNDQVGTIASPVDPKLDSLADNGGPNKTHALQNGSADPSPAIDYIPNGTNGCDTTYTTDQRSYDRPKPAGGSCDIGAYEYDPGSTPPAAPTLSITKLNSTTARLSWTESSGAVEYHLYRDNDPYFTPTDPAYYVTTALSYDDVGALGNSATNYYYVVKAASDGGLKSAASNRVGEFDFDLFPGD